MKASKPTVSIGLLRDRAIHPTLAAFGATILLLVCFASTGRAQSYAIDWFTVDGGGAVSTGGGFTLTGTIGQPDADTLSGGGFTLVGGFWGLIAAVQSETNAPELTISRISSNAIKISWPAPGEGWVCERTNLLTGFSLPWARVPPPYQTNAGVISVTYTNLPPGWNQFFRLRRP